MYGGAPKQDQHRKSENSEDLCWHNLRMSGCPGGRYRYGVHTIVACPGRLNDFLEGGQVRLDGVGS